MQTQSMAEDEGRRFIQKTLCGIEGKDPDIIKTTLHKGLTVHDLTNPKLLKEAASRQMIKYQQLGGSTRDRLRQKLAEKQAQK